MTKNGVGLDTWRDYFRSSNSDIFSIIEHAIMVAAWDCPYDFKVKRDGIAEMLYTCRMTKCLGCDRSELSSVAYDDDCLKGIDGDEEFKTGGSKDSKESKVKSSSRDEVNVKEDHDHDLEGLTDEIEEESHEFVEEIVRIKEVIDENEGKSSEVLFESLRRLQLMPLSVEILKSTGIGKSVYALQKHGSKEIRNLGRRLVLEWRRMVNNAWLAAKTKSDVEEEQEEEEEVAFLGDSKTPSTMKKEAPNAACMQPNSNNVVKLQQNGTLIQKKPLPQQQQDKSLVSDDQTRLEAAKRKLHQRYQEAENAKKRRMIQLVELRDLPKQSHRQRPQGRRC